MFLYLNLKILSFVFFYFILNKYLIIFTLVKWFLKKWFLKIPKFLNIFKTIFLFEFQNFSFWILKFHLHFLYFWFLQCSLTTFWYTYPTIWFFNPTLVFEKRPKKPYILYVQNYGNVSSIQYDFWHFPYLRLTQYFWEFKFFFFDLNFFRFKLPTIKIWKININIFIKYTYINFLLQIYKFFLLQILVIAYVFFDILKLTKLNSLVSFIQIFLFKLVNYSFIIDILHRLKKFKNWFIFKFKILIALLILGHFNILSRFWNLKKFCKKIFRKKIKMLYNPEGFIATNSWILKIYFYFYFSFLGLWLWFFNFFLLWVLFFFRSKIDFLARIFLYVWYRKIFFSSLYLNTKKRKN